MARPRKVTAMLASARSDRRRVGDWMATHHDELLAQLGAGRIDWHPLMRVIGQLDLRDEHGQPVTRDTAARTWARVRRQVADHQVRDAARAKLPVRPGEVAPGVRSLEFAAGPGTSPSLSPDIVPARARKAAQTRKGEQSHGSLVPAEDHGDAAERIRAVVGAFAAARVPMPKQSS